MSAGVGTRESNTFQTKRSSHASEKTYCFLAMSKPRSEFRGVFQGFEFRIEWQVRREQ